MTKKQRKIANQEVMIKNRDKLISNMSKQRHDLYNENKLLKELLSNIYYMATSNTYGNDKAILGKIRETIAPPQCK